MYTHTHIYMHVQARHGKGVVTLAEPDSGMCMHQCVRASRVHMLIRLQLDSGRLRMFFFCLCITFMH